MRIGMGLDGGGTKTECILMDESGHILGRGRGGPSNPSRIGIENAARGVEEAAIAALEEAGLQITQVSNVCAGLAGVADTERAAAMRNVLSSMLAGKKFELYTDLDLALAAAGAAPAIVLVAGTGSAAIGRDRTGRIARSGGHGPKWSDEGSAFAIGKRAVETVQNASNDDAKNLRERILEQLGLDRIEKATALTDEAADAVYPRVFPVIANAADEGNEIARELLRDAARNLSALVAGVQEELQLSGKEYVLAKTGGVMNRSRFLETTLDAELRQIAPKAELKILQTSLAEVAARRSLNL